MSRFITHNQPSWEELEHLLARAKKSRNHLTPDELARIDVVLRRTTIHLARVSSRTTDRQLFAYLNGLVSTAHSLIYLPPRRSLLSGAWKFLVFGFPRSVARHWQLHATSAALFFVGAILAYWGAKLDPRIAHALWPAGDPRQPGSSTEQLLDMLRTGRESGGGQKFFFASFLFQHNVRVAFLSLATGILAGIPTILLVILNGMMIGVFFAIHSRPGLTLEAWAWILAHGVTEISAIIICSGVGLMLGKAVVSPGLVSRKQSLIAAGQEAKTVVFGALLMLALAAVIESYVRQSHWSTGARFAFAAATALFWAVYFAQGYSRLRILRSMN